MIGNPARQTGWMSEHGCKLSFNNEGYAVCDGSKQAYLLKDGKVDKLKT
jgi:UDP-2-acetamido-3-amino-2,3-dideoxy-glucuronate N-acetyltransferase